MEVPWIQNSCGKAKILKIYCCKWIFKKIQSSWLFVSYWNSMFQIKYVGHVHRVLDIVEGRVSIERKESIFLASDRTYLTELEMARMGSTERSFFFSPWLPEKSHWKNPHHVWAYAEGDGAEMPLALDTVLIRTFLRATSPSQNAASVMLLSQFMAFFFFFPSAKDLGLRDCPDDLFSVPRGLINLKNPTRQLKPLPKTVIRSALSTASFLCSCCRDRSALKDAAWRFLMQQQQGKWWGSDLGGWVFPLFCHFRVVAFLSWGSTELTAVNSVCWMQLIRWQRDWKPSGRGKWLLEVDTEFVWLVFVHLTAARQQEGWITPELHFLYTHLKQ